MRPIIIRADNDPEILQLSKRIRELKNERT